MIKYIKEETLVAFSEIPDEITLCVNISNCCNHCIGCHSPYLAKNVGDVLDTQTIDELMRKNSGITCFCFMGEGNDVKSLQDTMSYIKNTYPSVKVGMYSGRTDVPEDFYWNTLDYLKIGPYIEEFGPLNKETTNQRLYMRSDNENPGVTESDIETEGRSGWIDVTSKFWRKH